MGRWPDGGPRTLCLMRGGDYCAGHRGWLPGYTSAPWASVPSAGCPGRWRDLHVTENAVCLKAEGADVEVAEEMTLEGGVGN